MIISTKERFTRIFSRDKFIVGEKLTSDLLESSKVGEFLGSLKLVVPDGLFTFYEKGFSVSVDKDLKNHIFIYYNTCIAVSLSNKDTEILTIEYFVLDEKNTLKLVLALPAGVWAH